LQENSIVTVELPASFLWDSTKVDAIRKNDRAVTERDAKSEFERIQRIVIDGNALRGNTSSEVAFPLLCFSLNWRTPMEELITAGEVVSGFC
jgi:hypothetical protein